MSTTKPIIMIFSLLFFNTSQADTNNSHDNDDLQPIAMYQEAMSYLLGRNGKEKSAEKAATLLKSLAEQNWGAAQHMLGNLYFEGKGVEKNNLLAYKWLSIASRNNLNLAQAIYSKRELLKSRLPRNTIVQIENWIEDWQPNQ